MTAERRAAAAAGIARPSPSSGPLPWIALWALLLTGLALALSTGSVSTPLGDLWAVLGGGGDPVQRAVILDLRLPRALAALCTGAMLALAGGLMQVLLRNPLADPYVLGVSGGAAVAVLLGMLAGFGAVLLNAAAFVGAMFAVLAVFGIAHGRGGWTPTRLLLTGVVMAAGWGAIISLLLALAPSAQLPGMLFWLMGDLSQARAPAYAWAALAVALALAWALARPLNLLARGELQAAALGVSVGPLRGMVYLLASMLAAASVTIAGSVGFVGLVVPHLMRMAMGADHRRLLPAAALAGATLLLYADTLARTVLMPQQLPVGVLTALLGVSVFLYLLHRGR